MNKTLEHMPKMMTLSIYYKYHFGMQAWLYFLHGRFSNSFMLHLCTITGCAGGGTKAVVAC